MKLDPILQRIDELLIEVENSKHDLQIALNLANLSMQDYIAIKRGSLDMPSNLSPWAFEELNSAAMKLKIELDKLNKLRKELFII